MIVDTSALVALIQEEPAAAQVAAVLARARNPLIAAPALAETLIVLTARHGPVARTIFERLRVEINLGVQRFGEEHAAAAQRAYLRFGTGRHPAGLNFGDCMTYAAADLAQDPLLAIGDDFPRPTSSSAPESSGRPANAHHHPTVVMTPKPTRSHPEDRQPTAATRLCHNLATSLAVTGSVLLPTKCSSDINRHVRPDICPVHLDHPVEGEVITAGRLVRGPRAHG